jgi:hypothetical protein
MRRIASATTAKIAPASRESRTSGERAGGLRRRLPARPILFSPIR